MNKWRLVGMGGLGALTAAVGVWWLATWHYEARVVELRTEIALRGWPTAASDVYDADAPRPDALVAALESLREVPGRRSSSLAPAYAALLLRRGALTTSSGGWNSELEELARVLDEPTFVTLLGAIDAQPALGGAFALEYDEFGFARATPPISTLYDAERLVRVHAERALGHGRTDEAALDAQRLLALGQWLGEQPSALLGITAKLWRREGLCVLRDVLAHGKPIAPERARSIAALLERARPDVEATLALDSERVLWVDPMWEFVRRVDANALTRSSGSSLEASFIGRPFVARAEIIALESFIRLRQHAATAPYREIRPFDRSDWPELADLVVPNHSSYFVGPIEERRALDLARIALAGLAPEHVDAPRDPVSGAPYSVAVADGIATVRADSPEKPRSWSWPLAWPLRG